MDDSIMDGDSIFNISDDENSDFVPEKPAPVSSTRSVVTVMQITDSLAAQKAKAKPAPKKAAATKPKAAAKKAPVKKVAAKKKAQADSEDEMSDVHMSDDDADSLLSQTPPKAKKATAPKRAVSKQPLADVENESFGGDAAGDAPEEGSVADKYKRVSCARQVIILRNRMANTRG